MRRYWPIGARVRLVRRQSWNAVPAGTIGTIVRDGAWRKVSWDGIPYMWNMLGKDTRLLSPLEELAEVAE